MTIPNQYAQLIAAIEEGNVDSGVAEAKRLVKVKEQAP